MNVAVGEGRLFVAVWPPPAVVESLSERVRPAIDGVRWTTAPQWHVTLRFLGDGIDIEEADRVLENGAPAPRVMAVIGAHPVLLAPGVVALDVSGVDAAARWAASLEVPGARRSDRDFRGHLTLARARRGLDVDVERLGAGHELRWEVREVVLVRSILDPAGAHYEVARRYPTA